MTGNSTERGRKAWFFGVREVAMDMLPGNEPSPMGSLWDEGLARSGLQGPDPGHALRRGDSMCTYPVSRWQAHSASPRAFSIPRAPFSPKARICAPLLLKPNGPMSRCVPWPSGQSSTVLFPCFPWIMGSVMKANHVKLNAHCLTLKRRLTQVENFITSFNLCVNNNLDWEQ